MNIRTFVAILPQNPQHDFPKMRGAGPFGTFPKIHPFWWRHLSLFVIISWSLSSSSLSQLCYKIFISGRILKALFACLWSSGCFEIRFLTTNPISVLKHCQKLTILNGGYKLISQFAPRIFFQFYSCNSDWWNHVCLHV